MKTIDYYILILLTLSACTSKDAGQEAATARTAGSNVVLTAEQYRLIGIELGSIEQRSLSGAIQVSGVLDIPPQSLISVSSPYPGFVKSTDMLEGKRVAKGDVLAVIQSAEYIQLQQDYLDAVSQLEFMEAEYNRQTALSRDSVNARKVLQQARSNFQSMSVKVSGLKAKLSAADGDLSELAQRGLIRSLITLRSPISGFVTAINVNLGMFVNPTDVILRVVDTEHLHVELQVFEKDVLRLRVGQKVRFVLANESQERVASVYLIGKEISDQRTVRVHCHIDHEDPSLIPGMYLSAFIETQSAFLPALPEQAVVEFEGGSYIFVPANQEDIPLSFERVRVQAGEHAQGFTSIILPAEFDLTKKVVVKGAYELLSAMNMPVDDE